MFIINVHHNIDVSLFIIKCILSNLIDGQKKLYFIRFFLIMTSQLFSHYSLSKELSSFPSVCVRVIIAYGELSHRHLFLTC